MICLLPLMLGQAKFRVWAALLGAALAALFMPFLSAFVAIDLIAAAIVLRRPAGVSQGLIGGLFVGMVFFELGYFLSPGNQQAFMLSSLAAIEWAQWFILMAWGLHDAWGYCIRRVNAHRRPVIARAGH